MSVSAAGTTPNRLYMKRDWQTDNAWFAAYFFGNGDKWVKMTDLGSGLYTCETPQDKAYTSVIFCRMNGSNSTLGWGAKWDQTGDLTLSASKDFYKGNSWTTFAPTIAGDGVLLGESWTPGSTANKMTKQNNGTYTLVKEGITLEKKAYEYKVTDGSWDWSVGKNGNNASLSINPAGKYNVTFTYTPSSNTVSAVATPIYTITASANPATAGTITGAGTYAKGASVALEATPNAGYKFVNWTEGGVEKSTDAKYSFTASADVAAVANFELSDPEVPTYAISVSTNDDAMGTVTGAGDYTEGSPVTLTATPNTGYRFVNWTVGGEVKSTEATYSFTASEALTIVANFEAIPKYDITVKAVVPEVWTSTTIGIHYWGDGISGTSTPVATEKEGNWNKYTIKDVLEGQSVNVIFLNGTSWGSDKSKQTVNIMDITEDKCFQISAKTLDGEGKCTVTEVDCAADIKPEGDVYTIMGAGELGLSWDLATTGNDMTKQADGTYTLVKEGLDLATTGTYEYKVVKNHSWGWSIPSGTENQTLKVDKDGTYTITFTLSSDKKKLTADALCTAEKEVILDCYVAGTINLVGGTADFTDELPMTYDEGTKTYSKTFIALAAGNYQMKVVYGSDWLGYDKLTTPVPANVTEGDDKKIKFSLAEAGDVTVTYNVEKGIGLVGNFADPVIDVYTIMGAGELGLSWDLATTGNDMTKQADGTYTLVKEGLDLATTGNYEYKVVKNHSWDWSIPSGNTNQKLTVDKDGTYTITFTLSADKKKLTADAKCTAEKEVILDCFVAGTTNLVGGTTDFTDELPMTYDEGTKTYSKTFIALAAGNYQMKVVYGSDWLGYDKLTTPVPANVTEGDDKKIKFSLAEAGDVTVTYNVEKGIGLTGNFAVPNPPVISYVLMGVDDDWTTGIPMTQNPDNADEYMLLGQAISATDAVKVVKLVDGEKSAFCGKAQVKDGSADCTGDGDDNIVLAAGIYDFYYKVTDNNVFIKASIAVTIRKDLTPGQWGTLCPTQNVENPTGATFYQIAYLEEKDRLPFNMHFNEVAGTLQAGQPYFFIASATEIKGVKYGAVMTEGSKINGFCGYIDEADAPWELPFEAEYDVNKDNTFVIWNNSVFRINAKTSIKSERCYIIINADLPSRDAVSVPAGARRITMGVSGINGQNTATGMENVDASAQPVKTIINGRLFILRGEKMYDAQGKLVK